MCGGKAEWSWARDQWVPEKRPIRQRRRPWARRSGAYETIDAAAEGANRRSRRSTTGAFSTTPGAPTGSATPM